MDRLDELIDECNEWDNSKKAELRGIFIELKELRRSQIQPAIKFLNGDVPQQWEHVKSEVIEAYEELRKYVVQINFNTEKTEQSRLSALDELNDLQISVETLKAIIEPDENKRRESMIRTIAKNEKRLYYYREDARD